MKLFLQILLFFFTWFSSSATPPLAKVGLPNYALSFPKAATQNLENELKIGVSNFVRSSIQENSFSQKAIFGESSNLTETRARMGGVVVNTAGKVAKYPINNFLDFVNSTFTTAQKQLFTKADNFYQSFNPSFNINELRGIDFDFPVTNVIKQEDNVIYQMATIDPVTGNPRFGSYFFENIDEDVIKLGIGDLNRIKADGRVKVKIILDDEVDFLKSKTANIEDWTGSGNIFEGGGNQFYNPTAKTKIKSFEIIKTY